MLVLRHTHQRCNLQHAFGRDKRWLLLLSYCSLPQRLEKKSIDRVLSNFSTTVSYVIYVFILAHSTECFTGERGLDENDLLYV